MEDPLVEGVTFLVKYLGNCGVENDSEEEETAAAIKNIITTVRNRLIIIYCDEIFTGEERELQAYQSVPHYFREMFEDDGYRLKGNHYGHLYIQV